MTLLHLLSSILTLFTPSNVVATMKKRAVILS